MKKYEIIRMCFLKIKEKFKKKVKTIEKNVKNSIIIEDRILRG